MALTHDDRVGLPLIAAAPRGGAACVRVRSEGSRPAAARLADILREYQQAADVMVDPLIEDMEGDDEDEGLVAVLVVQVPRLPDLQVEADVVEDPHLEHILRDLLTRHLARRRAAN